MIKLRYSKITLPTIPVGHPSYKWTSGADVQATWMRLTSWRPIYTNQPPMFVEAKTPGFVTDLAKHRKAG